MQRSSARDQRRLPPEDRCCLHGTHDTSRASFEITGTIVLTSQYPSCGSSIRLAAPVAMLEVAEALAPGAVQLCLFDDSCRCCAAFAVRCLPMSSVMWQVLSRRRGDCTDALERVETSLAQRAPCRRWCPINAAPAAGRPIAPSTGQMPAAAPNRSSAINVLKIKQLAMNAPGSIDRIEHPAIVVAVLDFHVFHRRSHAPDSAARSSGAWPLPRYGGDGYRTRIALRLKPWCRSGTPDGRLRMLSRSARA